MAGEVRSARSSLSPLLRARAYAHPGHFEGGEVTGELLGAFVVDWIADDGRDLGLATLLVGSYGGANFTFGRGTAERLPAGDPLVGHTARIAGEATRDDTSWAFTIVVDSPEGRELVGAPFEGEMHGDALGSLRLRILAQDPYEGDTLFDGIDFQALDRDGDGVVTLLPDDGEEASNLFRRTFQTHDHFEVIHAL